MRIASLLPSATEIVYALGLQDQLVGVTFECDYPGDPRAGRPILVGGLDTHGLDTAAIDDLVRRKAAAGENLYQLDEAALRQARPDVVLTQDLCRVCALPSDQVGEAMARMGCDATLVTYDPHTLEQILAGIVALGEATGAAPAANALVGSLRERLAAVAASVAGRARPRTFVLEWPDPPFLAGHWVPDLVEAAGGEAVLTCAGQSSMRSSWDAVAAVDPDVVIVASCGFDLDGTVAHARRVLDQVPARAAVWALDANAVVVRPGPRVVEGVETLAALLHGGEVDPALARAIRVGT